MSAARAPILVLAAADVVTQEAPAEVEASAPTGPPPAKQAARGSAAGGNVAASGEEAPEPGCLKEHGR
ncbi:hypothetical protein SAMN02745121_05815 [Nannocystis exedens]|uniref:Uncharacterized protein n=1 Tax=Nannocystis exedens TaxID=54 RepID=A0A1I2DYK1_9BACT|nr:hypothetical protein [Nannocystis exedens]PCC69170.1 hypothetical protein NAEX_02192 [Nannocystis exedens]SFE85822.1 hypothetical protein SAMN02745121_05815 [Nannocystis exedens]